MKHRTIIYLSKNKWSKKYTPSSEYILHGLQDKLDAAFFFKEFKPTGIIDPEVVVSWANKNWNDLGDFTVAREGVIGFTPAPGVIPRYIWNNSIKARRRSYITPGYNRILKPPVIVNWIPMNGVDNDQGENDDRSVATKA